MLRSQRLQIWGEYICDHLTSVSQHVRSKAYITAVAKTRRENTLHHIQLLISIDVRLEHTREGTILPMANLIKRI
jgi:hypothetical protein